MHETTIISIHQAKKKKIKPAKLKKIDHIMKCYL